VVEQNSLSQARDLQTGPTTIKLSKLKDIMSFTITPNYKLPETILKHWVFSAVSHFSYLTSIHNISFPYAYMQLATCKLIVVYHT